MASRLMVWVMRSPLAPEDAQGFFVDAVTGGLSGLGRPRSREPGKMPAMALSARGGAVASHGDDGFWDRFFESGGNPGAERPHLAKDDDPGERARIPPRLPCPGVTEGTVHSRGNRPLPISGSAPRSLPALASIAADLHRGRSAPRPSLSGRPQWPASSGTRSVPNAGA